MGGLEHDVSDFTVRYKRNEGFQMRQFILLFSMHVQWLRSRWKGYVVIGRGQLSSHLG